MSGSFEDNIERVISLVRDHAGVFSYLETVRHLVVDEAQDVVGLRCELLLEIINALPETAGVSVFSDEAQAIYGFAEDGSAAAVDGNLPEMIRAHFGEQFRGLELLEVHRTKDPVLMNLFGSGRSIVREKSTDGANRYRGVRDLVNSANHGDIGLYRNDISALPVDLTDALLLFRRRGEVLDASGYLNIRPHRLRMSGLPTCIGHWVAVLLWDWTKQEIDQDDFTSLWAERLGDPEATGADKSWSILIKHFGRSGSQVSLAKLVTKLAGSSPPLELSLPEFGTSGPIVGTIHGSKGREAGEVRLYLPPPPQGNADGEAMDEEAKIVFVGATRAKTKLQVGRAATAAISRRLEPSGRAFTPYPYKEGRPIARAAVEIGRSGDIDAAGLVGRALYASAEEAVNSQLSIMGLHSKMTRARALATSASQDWRYKVVLEGNDLHLNYLSVPIGGDMFRVAQAVDAIVHLGRRRPPNQLNNLRIFGVRTLAVAQDNPVREQLHAPWRDSGLILAPMLIGYSMAYFR